MVHRKLTRLSSALMIATGTLTTLVAVALARLAFGLILPPMQEGLGLSYGQAGNLGTATALGYLALVMVAGALASRRGGRLSILLGLVLITLGFTGLSLASNYLVVLGLMTVLGFGTAFAFTPLISLLGTWFPERRGFVIGLLNSGVGIGMLVAGWLVPYLTETYGGDGWRVVWALYAALGGAVTMAGFAFLKNPPRPIASKSHSAPVADKAAVFKNPYVVTVGLIYGIVGMTYIVQAIFMYSYSLDTGIPPLTAGRLAALMGLIGIFSGPVWGAVSDRVGRANSLLLAIATAFVAMAIPVVWPTLAGFAAHYIILGGSVTGMFTSVLAASTERVAPHEAPLAVSYVTLFFAVGQFIGPTAAGFAIGATDGFRSTFAVSSLFLFIGILLSWRLTRFKTDAQAAPASTRSASTHP